MLKKSTTRLLAIPAVASILSWCTPPASAQRWFSDYNYNPGYYTTYVDPSYGCDNYRTGYYYDPVTPVVTGAAIGGLAGFGLSFLGPRHHRRVVRNTAIGAGIGAGIGLLDGLLRTY